MYCVVAEHCSILQSMLNARTLWALGMLMPKENVRQGRGHSSLPGNCMDVEKDASRVTKAPFVTNSSQAAACHLASDKRI